MRCDSDGLLMVCCQLEGAREELLAPGEEGRMEVWREEAREGSKNRDGEIRGRQARRDK